MLQFEPAVVLGTDPLFGDDDERASCPGAGEEVCRTRSAMGMAYAATLRSILFPVRQALKTAVFTVVGNL